MAEQTTRPAPFRLVLRVEGSFWNAYLAESDTMDGAELLGSIRMAAVESSPEMKARFMQMMQDLLAMALREAAGITMSWPEPPQPAPEHERSGSA